MHVDSPCLKVVPWSKIVESEVRIQGVHAGVEIQVIVLCLRDSRKPRKAWLMMAGSSKPEAYMHYHASRGEPAISSIIVSGRLVAAVSCQAFDLSTLEFLPSKVALNYNDLRQNKSVSLRGFRPRKMMKGSETADEALGTCMSYGELFPCLRFDARR